MARHGENIYKRRDGRYEGRYIIGKTLGGKTRFGYIYGHQYAEVKRALLLKKAEYAMSNTANGTYKGKVSEWMDEWMENEIRGSVKVSSWQTYMNLLKKHILPALGELMLAAVTPGIVREWIDELENSGLSGSTVRSAYRLFAAAMKAAREDGQIQKSPCRKIRIQNSEKEEQRVLTRREQEMVKASAADAKELPALLSLYTGMRLGEICALKWADVDFDHGTITIRRTVQRVLCGAKTMIMIGTPKSLRSRRTIPIPAFLMKQLREMTIEKDRDAFIFGTAISPAEPRTIQRRFSRFMERLGIRNVHFHTLRHSFATRLLELGVDIKTVSVLL